MTAAFCNTSPIDPKTSTYPKTSTWQTTFLLSPETMATTPTHWWAHGPLGSECPVVKLSLGVRQQCTLGRRKHHQTQIPQRQWPVTDFTLVHGRVRKERPTNVRGWSRIVRERPHSDRFPGRAAFLGALFLMLRQVSDLNKSCFSYKKKSVRGWYMTAHNELYSWPVFSPFLSSGLYSEMRTVHVGVSKSAFLLLWSDDKIGYHLVCGFWNFTAPWTNQGTRPFWYCFSSIQHFGK